MIYSMTVTNYLGESLELVLTEPEQSGFAVARISGLGPPKSTINTTETAIQDGSRYNSARMGARNIVILLKLLENPTIEDSRQRTYRYFPSKKPVTLRFRTDRRTVEITGYVESNEPGIFSNMETTQISIICPNPYFSSAKSDDEKSVSLFGTDPLFEFEYENNSLIESLTEFGEIQHLSETTVEYDGDVETGLTIRIAAAGNASNVTLYNTGTHESMVIDTTKLTDLTGSAIVSGDEIWINTNKGKKSITLLRNGIETNILSCLDRNTDWFTLYPGSNTFAYDAESGWSNLIITFGFNIIYEGI